MAIAFSYTESNNIVLLLGGSSGTPATYADFVHFDRTFAAAACSIGSGAELKAATAVAADTDLTLTYPMRPVEHKALRLAITAAQNGGAAISGDETVDIFGTTAVWQKLTGVSASGQKVVPIEDLTHNYQVGDTVILIDISSPATYETDTIASIQEGVSITLTNNNTNSYAIGDIVGIYQTEQIDTHTPGFGTVWTTMPYGQIAMLTFTGYDGTNTAKVDQPIWGIIWDYGAGQYQIDALFHHGDGATPTYFESLEESVYFSSALDFVIRTYSNSYFYLGEKIDNDRTQKGSWLKLDTSGFTYCLGEVGIYGSLLIAKNASQWVNRGSAEVINSIISTTAFNSAGNMILWRLRHVLFNNYRDGINLGMDAVGTLDLFDITVNDATYGFRPQYDLDVTVEGFKTSNCTYDIGPYQYEGTCIILDSVGTFSIVWSGSPKTGEILQKFNTNIHVADKDGNNLQSVTVLCEDEADSQVFSVSTDAGGDIAEQQVTHIRYYYDGGNQTTTYSPHKFTLSLAGYETLILENVTVDGPIDWHLELQPATGPGVQKQWR